MEQHFIVSARKYRPATFDTVVGQSHITTTLKNAINNNQLAQAFLFCGPRGVGKTTCARILAKTINCTNHTADCEPCNECDSCTSFNNSTSFNIYELDAASNNSVDDIRALVDQVRIPPQGSRYKVYIIDEVHMLSSNAFNAFLKTLEEPPSYAIFILATTEKHKILPTILSRCQIFDFKRIRVADIANHLKYIAQKEHITFDEQALHIIAEKADGALRDALSIFDQTASFTNQNITYANVIENLNILDYDYFFRMMTALGTFKIADALLLYDDIMRKGFDGHHFVVGLSEHIRNLMVCKDPSTITLLEVVESVASRYQSQAEAFSPLLLLRYLSVLNDCDVHYKQARNQRLHVELTLMRMAYISAPKTEDADKKKIADQSVPNTVDKEPAPIHTEEPVKPVPVRTQTDNIPKPNASTGIRLGTLQGLKNSIITENKNQSNPTDNPSGDYEPLTEAQIRGGIESMLQTLPINGKNAYHFIFSKSTWTWEDDKQWLHFAIPADFYRQEESLNYRQEIQSYLKTTFKRPINISIVKGENLVVEEHKVYTVKEKLDFMINANPEIRTMIDRLGLDLIY